MAGEKPRVALDTVGIGKLAPYRASPDWRGRGLDDALVVEVPGEKPRVALDTVGIGKPAAAPVRGRAIRRVRERADHLVLEGAVGHNAARMRSMLLNRRSDVREGEKASKVTAFACGQRAAA